MRKEHIPTISVIVPNYNYACYLKERINSILQQTYTDYELILLDDASTDGSVKILEEYRTNPHVSHIVINKENTRSPFIQWMKGIRLARGKYIWIAEADDSAKPDFLEQCVRLAEAHDNTAICYAGSYLIDANGEIKYHRDVNHWGIRKKKNFAVFDGESFARYNLYWKNYIINASGALFRREYAEKVSQSPFLSMKYCGDWLFWFELSMQGRVIELYQVLNYFRSHNQKVTIASHKNGNGVKEDILIVNIMESRLTGLSNYKKRLRHGLLYKKIRRLRIDSCEKDRLYKHLYDTLGANVSDYFLERRNSYLKWLCPSLITIKRERLK